MSKTTFSSTSFWYTHLPGEAQVPSLQQCEGLEPWCQSQMWKLSLRGRPRLSTCLFLISEAPSWLSHLQHGQKDFSFSRASEDSQQPSGGVTKAMALSGLEKRHKEKLLWTFHYIVGFFPPEEVIEDCVFFWVYGSNCCHSTHLNL